MILLNALQKEPAVPLRVMLDFLRLLAPLAPHIAEELWARLGQSGSIMRAGWPAYDAAKLIATTITIVFQVNGKHRGDIQVPASTTEQETRPIGVRTSQGFAASGGQAVEALDFRERQAHQSISVEWDKLAALRINRLELGIIPYLLMNLLAASRSEWPRA